MASQGLQAPIPRDIRWSSHVGTFQKHRDFWSKLLGHLSLRIGRSLSVSSHSPSMVMMKGLPMIGRWSHIEHGSFRMEQSECNSSYTRNGMQYINVYYRGHYRFWFNSTFHIFGKEFKHARALHVYRCSTSWVELRLRPRLRKPWLAPVWRLSFHPNGSKS